jgi:glycosyltransferase involved in cell wall biosynthesis
MPDALQPELYETTDKTMGNQRWIGYFGSLHPWQGVEDAIDAFSMIAGSFEDVKMLIITGGKKEVRKQIRKRIRKLGLEAKIIIHHPMQQALLATVISRMEFTLAPLKETPRNTIQGCCPVKIIESMATGTPVIASGLSCVSSLISHQKDGWLVPAGNSRAFALAMKTLLQSKELVSSLSENARLTASYNFHQSIIHKHLCNFFTNTTH